ncbi:hypothetical protein H1C71_015829 [Ictidomys tridecemlineatus]|nr:hypothetical protein H1C71_015829 [Ictidomys tridecemlineatus]
MALLGREGLNKVREGGERTPGFFHSKGVSPSEFRSRKEKGMKREKCQGLKRMCLLLLSFAGERILSLFPSDFLSPLDVGEYSSLPGAMDAPQSAASSQHSLETPNHH